MEIIQCKQTSENFVLHKTQNFEYYTSNIFENEWKLNVWKKLHRKNTVTTKSKTL